MDTLKLEQDKLNLISWIAELEDIKLIQKLKEFQAKNSSDIPQWQKDIVLERIDTANKEDYISWDVAKKSLSK